MAITDLPKAVFAGAVWTRLHRKDMIAKHVYTRHQRYFIPRCAAAVSRQPHRRAALAASKGEYTARELEACTASPKATSFQPHCQRCVGGSSDAVAPGAILAYRVHELGPDKQPWCSGWRWGCVTAFAAHDQTLSMAPWPEEPRHPMQGDWELYTAAVLAGPAVRSSDTQGCFYVLAYHCTGTVW